MLQRENDNSIAYSNSLNDVFVVVVLSSLLLVLLSHVAVLHLYDECFDMSYAVREWETQLQMVARLVHYL